MKKPTGGLSRKAKLGLEMKRAAAQLDADETAALEAHEARAAEIDARPTFGAYLSEALKAQASAIRATKDRDCDTIANILEEVANDELLLDSRRGEGIRDYALQSALDKAPAMLKPSVKLAVSAAIEAAREQAGPSGVTLHAQVEAGLNLDGGAS